MQQRRYLEVDVFGSAAYRGNPLAVVVEADGLTTEQMQRFANWTNFSETTFILPPTDLGADYRVRIFTPVEELPFAGHPTLGTAHVWLADGGVPAREGVLVQECGVGLVEVRTETSGTLAFAAPPLVRSGPVGDALRDEVLAALGVDPSTVVDTAWIDNGPGWLGVLLVSAADVLALEPSFIDHKVGVIGLHPAGSEAAYEVRGFFPKDGALAEDPVTGSLNASAAQWLIAERRVTPPYTATQGSALGRDGRVSISVDAHGHIWVGGAVTECVIGTVVI